MPVALLQTKLYRPTPRSNLVQRVDLVKQVDRGLDAGARLVLVSAPPGFGKTTLIAEWLEKSRYPAAWLSLDGQDNDPVRFFTYLVSALQTVSPGIGESLLSSLASPEPPPITPLLTLLLNELCARSRDMVLVLDDYHAIDAPAIHKSLTFLIDNLPPQLHLVITTRVDPPLPLARYRSRAQVAEIRTDDLRFTREEAALFLNQVMGLGLTPEDIAVLEARTEGWVVGLQMAALSIQGRPDPTRFVQAFSGSNRYILDYLLEEVLGRQSPEMQQFLTQTSILEQMAGPLCDVVTVKTDSQAWLEKLERDNLFVVPLDDESKWFRYHHLFRDLLRARLEQFQKQDIPALHTRAADWYEMNGFRIEAVSQALAAKDFTRAARVLEGSGSILLDTGLGLTAFLSWVGMLPRDELVRHSLLSFRSAFFMIMTGRLEEGDKLMREAEEYLHEHPILDAARVQNAQALAAYARTYSASFHGDFETALQHALYALAQTRDDDGGMRSSVLTAIGELSAVRGQLDEASRRLSEVIPYEVNHGRLHLATNSYCRLAETYKAQGKLVLAAELYQQSFRLLHDRGDNPPGCVGMVQVGMGDLLRERDQLQEAEALLTKGLEHTRLLGRPYEEALAYLAALSLRLSQKNLEAARKLVREGEELARSYPAMLPVGKRIDLARVRLWLATGDLTVAADWARARKLAGDPLDYYNEPERLLAARILIAQGELDEAIRFLGRLEQAAQLGGRTGRLIEILVLQVVAFFKQGRYPDAIEALTRALALAEPEGYVRVFVDEGDAIRTLLHRVNADSRNPHLREYTIRLLRAFGETPIARPASPSANSTLLERLSARELEVLRLVGQGLSNSEIADRLVISLPTVKKHVQNIHGKLGARNRTQAILRAQELKLL